MDLETAPLGHDPAASTAESRCLLWSHTSRVALDGRRAQGPACLKRSACQEGRTPFIALLRTSATSSCERSYALRAISSRSSGEAGSKGIDPHCHRYSTCEPRSAMGGSQARSTYFAPYPSEDGRPSSSQYSVMKVYAELGRDG